MRADTETANGTQTLAESTNDEIDLGLYARSLCRAATALPEDTHGVGLINQQVATVLPLDLGDILQRRDVPEHGINALGDDQCLSGPFTQTSHPFRQVLGIAVLEADDLRAAELDPGINTGMAVGVQQDHVSRPGQGGAHSHGGGVAGGEDDGVVDTVKSGDFIFQCLVFRKGAVGQPRAGSAGAPARGRILRSLDATRVIGQTHIIVGARKNDLLSLHDALGGGEDFRGDCPERLDLALCQLRLEIRHGLEFVEQHYLHLPRLAGTGP